MSHSLLVAKRIALLLKVITQSILLVCPSFRHRLNRHVLSIESVFLGGKATPMREDIDLKKVIQDILDQKEREKRNGGEGGVGLRIGP